MNNGTSSAPLVKTGGASISRQGFGETSIELRRETASTAVAAQAQAEIQAMYVVARTNPRDWDDVRTRLLKECGRTAFADKALYALPRGNKPDGNGGWVPNLVEGLSVRFAEAVIRLSGNLRQSTATLYDDPDQRIIRVKVVDLETNGEYSRDVVIEKTIERKDARDRVVISSRQNSYDKTVYLVESTEDELAEKEGRAISKTFRTLALRFLPADILEDCNEKIRATRAAETKADPERVRKQVADAFATMGIQPSELKTYLDHDLGASSPAELDHLRGLLAAIRSGEVKWKDALAEKAAEADDAAKTKSVAEKLAERQAKKVATPEASSTATSSPTTSPSAKPAASAPAPTETKPAAPAVAPELFGPDPKKPAPAPPEEHPLVTELRGAIAACFTQADLARVARGISDATKAKRLTAAQSAPLLASVTEREATLKGETDGEPPEGAGGREPGVD